jgi:membrane protease YdiL (CAAX protease family)
LPYYIIGLILVLFVLLLIPRDAFLRNKILVIIGIMLYSVLYFLLIYFNSHIQNTGKFYLLDICVFGLIILLIPVRPFTLLQKKEFYMSFDVLHKSLTLIVLLFLNYRKINIGFNFPLELKYWLETILFIVLSMGLSAIIAVKTKFSKFVTGQIDLKELFIISVFMFLFVALPEEIIFRGVLLNYLNNFVPVIISILIGSIIFGIVHIRYGLKLFLFGGLMGLFYCSLYILTKNIICVAIMHTIINLFRKYYFADIKG